MTNLDKLNDKELTTMLVDCVLNNKPLTAEYVAAKLQRRFDEQALDDENAKVIAAVARKLGLG